MSLDFSAYWDPGFIKIELVEVFKSIKTWLHCTGDTRVLECPSKPCPEPHTGLPPQTQLLLSCFKTFSVSKSYNCADWTNLLPDRSTVWKFFWTKDAPHWPVAPSPDFRARAANHFLNGTLSGTWGWCEYLGGSYSQSLESQYWTGFLGSEESRPVAETCLKMPWRKQAPRLCSRQPF